MGYSIYPRTFLEPYQSIMILYNTSHKRSNCNILFIQLDIYKRCWLWILDCIRMPLASWNHFTAVIGTLALRCRISYWESVFRWLLSFSHCDLFSEFWFSHSFRGYTAHIWLSSIPLVFLGVKDFRKNEKGQQRSWRPNKCQRVNNN